MKQYVVQSTGKDGTWYDFAVFNNPSPTKAYAFYLEMENDPMWRDEGKRHWRLIKRITTEKVMEATNDRS